MENGVAILWKNYLQLFAKNNRNAALPCISTVSLENRLKLTGLGDPAQIIDPDTGEIIKAYIFVGVMTYSQYAYAEVFINKKQQAWITAYVHIYEYFGGVSKILVVDNCKIAVVHN